MIDEIKKINICQNNTMCLIISPIENWKKLQMPILQELRTKKIRRGEFLYKGRWYNVCGKNTQERIILEIIDFNNNSYKFAEPDELNKFKGMSFDKVFLEKRHTIPNIDFVILIKKSNIIYY